MQQMTGTLIRAISAVLVSLGLISTAGPQADVPRDHELRHPAELTEVDAFASRDWNAQDIRILGFFLGMTKAKADETARKQDLLLNCLNWCGVCNKQKTLCSGIGLHFDNDGHIDAISVGRPLQEASPALRKFSVTQRFKGKTHLFFHNYSNTLRIKLFGPESDRNEDKAMRTTTYFYPQRGVEIHVDLSPNKNIHENDADLDITFKRPKKPEAQASKSSS